LYNTMANHVDMIKVGSLAISSGQAEEPGFWKPFRLSYKIILLKA